MKERTMTQEEKREIVEELNRRVFNSGGNLVLWECHDLYHADKGKEKAAECKASLEKQFAWLGQVKGTVRPIGFSVDYKGVKCKVALVSHRPPKYVQIKVSS
jgi:hypothetical protein